MAPRDPGRYVTCHLSWVLSFKSSETISVDPCSRNVGMSSRTSKAVVGDSRSLSE